MASNRKDTSNTGNDKAKSSGERGRNEQATRVRDDGRRDTDLDDDRTDQRMTAQKDANRQAAEATLQGAFDRQFAGEDQELDAAAQSLSLWGVEYVSNEGEFSDSERVHYAQVIEALGAWAAGAPLADRARARASIVRLASAARATGLDEPADFTALGMTGTLDRLQPFVAATMRTLADYGLDLGASLEGLQVKDVSQDGDRAVVQVSYPLAGTAISTEVQLERIDGRWYPSDSVRNARASLVPAAMTGDAPEDGAVPGDSEPDGNTADGAATPAG